MLFMFFAKLKRNKRSFMICIANITDFRQHYQSRIPINF